MVDAVLQLLRLYALLGSAFALGFVARGAAVVVPAARGSGLAFRCMLIPGAMLLWPWLALRWIRR